MLITLRELVDGALLVQFPEAPESEANRAAVALGQALSTRHATGLLDAIPAARTLMLFYDPDVTSFDRLADGAIAASGNAGRALRRERRAIRIPVAYGGGAGPDLTGLAAELGISPEGLARRHAQGSYRVAFIGFAPGFPYLSGLATDLRARRLATPRPRVPAGSVAIGGSYTGIYPEQTAGGWRLIGRAPVRLFDPEETPPALLRPEDEISFEAIPEEELARREATFRRFGLSASSGPPLFRVLAPGMWTSVQGAPCFGLGSSGVPPGGAMDLRALSDGNALLGNPTDAAALEVTMVGPELECLKDCRVAISGATIDAESGGTPLAAGRSHAMRAGDRLRLGRTSGGARSYLCIENGLERPKVAVSRRLEKADLLHAAGEGNAPATGISGAAELLPAGRIRIVPGPHGDRFHEDAFQRLTSLAYRVSAVSDRRGIRLEGEPLDSGFDSEIPPEGTPLGAIQVPPDGQPILLGPDRPVTGGYARIATVVPEDWSRAAQALPGTELRFEVARSGRTRSVRIEPAAGG
jgi:antagonist of KipI